MGWKIDKTLSVNLVFRVTRDAEDILQIGSLKGSIDCRIWRWRKNHERDLWSLDWKEVQRRVWMAHLWSLVGVSTDS